MTLPFQPPPGRGGAQTIPRPAAARVGSPASWVGHSPPTLAALTAAVKTHRPTEPVPLAGSRPSAVLAALIGTAEPALLLTKRTTTMRHHRGELSFPGGRMESGESAVETALREAREEVNLDPTGVEIVGRLDTLTTVVSTSLIFPVVAVVNPDAPLIASPAEVDSIIVVPICELVTPGVYRHERWGIGGVERSVHFFELVGETLWGATARMVVQLLDLATAHSETGTRSS
jgi:8-oxo-dGTP pyrophosphatase MutT (NUDIX family)